MTQKHLAILLPVLFLLSCHAHKDQPHPGNTSFREYYVTYNKTRDSTTVFAIIYDNNTGDTMEIPIADLQVNGMTGTRKPDNTFAWFLQGMPDIRFAYKTAAGMTEDKVLRADLGDMNFNSSTPNEIGLTDTTVFTVDCSPLDPAANQDLFIGFEVTNSNTVLVGSKTGYKKLSDTNVVLDPYVMKSLSPGTYQLILYRKHYVQLMTNGQTGNGEVVPKLEIERKVLLK